MSEGPLPEDFDGEVSEENLKRLVRRCEELHFDLREERDKRKGAERDVNTWRVRHANLARDKEAEAKTSPLWSLAVRLFKVWVEAAGKDRVRTRFRYDRFEMLRPFLGDCLDAEREVLEVSYDREAGPPQNGLEEAMAAIIGVCFDPFVTHGKNGKPIVHNDLELAFRDSKHFAAKMELRPRDWRARMRRFDPEAPPEEELPGLEEAA